MSTILPGDPMWANSLVGGNGVTISSSGTYQSIDLMLTGNKDFQELMTRVGGIEKRLSILRPNWELQARYPALQEAYEHYRTIEALVNDQNRDLE